MASRVQRLREYAKPTSREWWHGESHDIQNLNRWSARATENSAG
jgi:hypothetical protein